MTRPQSSPDVFSGPAVRAARAAARRVKPGRLELTAFTAYDTGDLIDLEGRSFILKLPRKCAPNPRYHITHQWHVQGKPVGPIHYQSGWADWYIEKTRCWLIDIAFLRNWFSTKKVPETMLFWRLKSLDRPHGWGRCHQLLPVPSAYRPRQRPSFQFWFDAPRAVTTGVDIPLGVWFATTRQINGVDPLQVTRAAPVACIIYIRFQEHTPTSH